MSDGKPAGELASLRIRHEAAQSEKEDLNFKLRMKRVKMEQLGEEMNKLNDQLKDEEGWSNAVQRQLEAIRKDNDSLNQDRFEAIAKGSGFGGSMKRKHRTSPLLIGQCLIEACDR